MMKPQLGIFSNVAFVFNTDGSAELGMGTEMEESATYTVDEVNSTIITKDKNQKEDVLKADFKEEKLRITVKQPQGEILLILKKQNK